MPWYINMENQTVSDTEPDLTGKTKVTIAVPDNTPLAQVILHLDAVEKILTNPFTSIGAVVLEIDMNATWYIDVLNGIVTSTQPDMTGRTEIPFPVPNDTTIANALAQLDALQVLTSNPIPTTVAFVFRIDIGA